MIESPWKWTSLKWPIPTKPWIVSASRRVKFIDCTPLASLRRRSSPNSLYILSIRLLLDSKDVNINLLTVHSTYVWSILARRSGSVSVAAGRLPTTKIPVATTKKPMKSTVKRETTKHKNQRRPTSWLESWHWKDPDVHVSTISSVVTKSTTLDAGLI